MQSSAGKCFCLYSQMATNSCKIDIPIDEPEKCEELGSYMKKFSQPLEMFGKKMYKLGRDDPRRIIHAIKVGLALSVVSLFYLMEPLFDGVGDNAIWAIMTVVVVFEFTAGATLSKGLNRGISTVIAGEDLHDSTIKRIHGLAGSVKGTCSHYCGMNECESRKIVEGYNDVLDSKASEESLANFASWEPGHGKFGFRHPWKQYVKIGDMLRHMSYCVVALHGCLQSEYQAKHINRLRCKKPSSYKVGIEVAKILNELAESIKCMRQCPPLKSMMKSLHVELHNSFRFHTKLLPLYKPDHNRSNSLEADDILHANPTPQSTQPHHKPIIQIFEDNGDVAISTETIGNHDCNSELHVGLKEVCPAVNTEKENNVLLSIDAPPKIYGLSEEVPFAAFAFLVMEMVARLEHVIEAVQELGRFARFKP
ncbi:hypothetical protein KI387_024785 [Taxus chinensis]|uniref:Aluminum-activated malate transporter n=1 Tax=Taxus chinensis TaxID=29808 RepID=A0AA38L910_TAXCH|nr:hypothetical protein KI387_024785 [Taxus chinensis]